jgi:serine/threonine-protein kinase
MASAPEARPAHEDETMVAVAPGAMGPQAAPNPAPPSSALSVGASAVESSVIVSAAPGSGERQVLADRYEILALLGAGGMGTVYRARDLELDELVALKVMRRELLETPGILDRFRREAKLARRVTHKNVARVFDIGEHGGERFLTMELVDGESLSALLAREGALPLARVAEIAGGIVEGLGAAHAAGVVHRDLKPDNVLMAKDGRVVITDFGIARALEIGGAAKTMGGLVGTPAYMAPEQVEGKSDVDARADIYAFGALLYELMTGRRAWQGDAPFAVAAARLISPPPDPRAVRPDLPTAWAEIVLRAMARSPADRPASIAEVGSVLASLTIPAAASPIAPPPASTLLGAPSPPPTGEKAVAVLPFRNAGAPDDDYLAEELTDDLIDALSMTRGLKVRARGAVQRFRGVEQDPREIGRELGVQVVVEGSVRRARGNVRINARLLSVADGFQLWAKRFDRPEQEVLSINDEAARAIAEALTVNAGAHAREAPSDPVAIDLYIRARHEYRKFWPGSVRRSIELFDQALALAPNDPLLLSGQAIALARLAFFEGAAGASRARGVAERAVAAAPLLGEAHLALGSALFQGGEMIGAVRALRNAVQKAPGLAEAHAALGRLLVEIGAVDEGLRRLEAARALDAEMHLVYPEILRVKALLGKWDEAEAVLEVLRRPETMTSYWTFRARLALWQRRMDDAHSFISQIPEGDMSLRTPRMLLEILKNREVPPDAAEIERTEAAGGSRRITFMMQMRAELLGYLDKHEQVVEALSRAAASGLIDLLWLERCPLLDEARKDPRYPAVHAVVKQRTDAIYEAYRSGV